MGVLFWALPPTIIKIIMKKYFSPAIKILNSSVNAHILQTTDYKIVDENGNPIFGGGGDGDPEPAKRHHSVWDEFDN